MATHVPRLVVAGLAGDSGKTVVCLSMLTALRQRGVTPSVFKKGPDYIDAAWLSLVGGTVCRNLDTHLVAPSRILDTFTANASAADFALIEGNRGLFDGMDVEGTHSTAALARLLGAPVVLVVGVTKVTRTVAAIVNGCLSFEPEIRIAGAIMNRVAGKRHERIVARSIERYCGLPILGAIPNLGDDAGIIPGRHLGLVTPAEFEHGLKLEETLGRLADSYLDMDGLVDCAQSAEPLRIGDRPRVSTKDRTARVGYLSDSIFTFYYPENLEALNAEGADLVPISSLDDAPLPDIDALYIGGGFPETQAQRLSRNTTLFESVREAADDGMPIYAECGGLIFLSRSITWKNERFPMAGVFPVDLAMEPKPVGHGYTKIRVDRENPFFEVGEEITGHEFHYSKVIAGGDDCDDCMLVERGTGTGSGRDGLIRAGTLACYTHIHSDGVPGWSSAFVSRAREYRNRRKQCDRKHDTDHHRPVYNERAPDSPGRSDAG